MAGAEWLMKRCRKGKKKEGRKEQREGLRDRGRDPWKNGGPCLAEEKLSTWAAEHPPNPLLM
jgi:hypothetical protein